MRAIFHSLLSSRTRIVGPALCAATALCAASALAQATPKVDTQRLAAPADANVETYFGTVRASDMAGLSYGARGCIVEISDDAKHSRIATAGQVLVRLDDRRSQLALRTAQSRVLELETALKERELAIAAAEADDLRKKQDLEFVTEEYQRNSTMLGRGLINETAMDAVERRFMESNFAAERAQEAIENALAAKRRAEIALEIGKLEVQSAEVNHSLLLLTAPIDGVLVGFDANVGDCVQEGEQAAQIYAPDEKSIELYFLISRLSATEPGGVAIGATVNFRRVNGQMCQGKITRLDTEADLETQYVEATIDVDPSCAPNLFLNEAVEVEAAAATDAAFSVPSTALSGENQVFLVDEATGQLQSVEVEVVRRGSRMSILRIPNADGRLLVTGGDDLSVMADGLTVDVREPG